MKAVLAAALLALSPLAGQAPAPAAAPATAPPEAPRALPRVQIETTYGPIVVVLEPALAPKTVANFLRYVQEGFYDGTIWHRVIAKFMIQGGGMLPDLTEKPAHEPIANEAPDTYKAGLKNTRGTLAMARTENPHSATAQFYINTNDNPSLDHKDFTPAGYGYCVFGHVVSGMDAVDKIEKVTTVMRRGMQSVPEYPVRIRSARLLPNP